MLTIAHRGASALYPENTLRAFLAAPELGDGERLSGDVVVVVIRGGAVNARSGGRGRVVGASGAAITGVGAGVAVGAHFRDDRSPPPPEVAPALAGRC